MNKYNEAIQCYDKALEINPRDAEAWYNKGNVYYDMNKYDKAIKYIIKSISLFILQNKDIDLIESLTHSIIEIITQRSINEEIRKDAEVISYVSLYLIGSFTREECINKIKDLKGSARREALIHAVINNEDRHIAINDIVDEAFNDLKRCVLEMQNK
jgi:tetratricopeptide (TPR) repeat protein